MSHFEAYGVRNALKSAMDEDEALQRALPHELTRRLSDLQEEQVRDSPEV